MFACVFVSLSCRPALLQWCLYISNDALKSYCPSFRDSPWVFKPWHWPSGFLLGDLFEVQYVFLAQPSPKSEVTFWTWVGEKDHIEIRQLIYASGFCMTYAMVFWKIENSSNNGRTHVRSQWLFACVKHRFTISEFSPARITAIILGTQARTYQAHKQFWRNKRFAFELRIIFRSTNAKNMKWGCPQRVKP